MTRDPSRPAPTDARIQPADADAAGHLPCLLAAGAADVLTPWLASLHDHDLDEVVAALTMLDRCARRLALLATRHLPKEDEPLIGALTARLWSLGVAASATLIEAAAKSELDREAYETRVTERAREQLQTRYADDPARIRRDGLDLLAGSLLVG